jgi:hypothetical protein
MSILKFLWLRCQAHKRGKKIWGRALAKIIIIIKLVIALATKKKKKKSSYMPYNLSWETRKSSKTVTPSRFLSHIQHKTLWLHSPSERKNKTRDPQDQKKKSLKIINLSMHQLHSPKSKEKKNKKKKENLSLIFQNGPKGQHCEYHHVLQDKPPWLVLPPPTSTPITKP